MWEVAIFAPISSLLTPSLYHSIPAEFKSHSAITPAYHPHIDMVMGGALVNTYGGPKVIVCEPCQLWVWLSALWMLGLYAIYHFYCDYHGGDGQFHAGDHWWEGWPSLLVQ